jgi:hypothetical protein
MNGKKNFTVHQRWSKYEDGVKFLLQIGETELAYQEWINLQKEEWVDKDQFTYRYQTILRITDFESILKRGLVDSFHIHKMAKKENQITLKRGIPSTYRVNNMTMKSNNPSLFWLVIKLQFCSFEFKNNS